MKLQYYMMSLALAVSAPMIFTSCDDDDDIDGVSSVIEYPGKPGDINLAPGEAFAVKSGAESKQPLPVEGSYSGLKATSLDESVAIVTEENGHIYVQGVHRGKTQILVSTADGSYVQIPVSVYDYSSVRFSNENITQTLMLGKQNEVEVDLIEGNDDYSFTSDNPRVSAFYNDATGKVTVSAKAGKEEYTATLTCTDGSDRKGTIKVTVTPSFEAFTADEINDIKANTRSEIWADVKDPSDGNTPYYYPYYKDEYPWFYISQDIEDGQHRLGWWWDGNEYFRGGYGGLVITYAAGTTAGQQSQGYLTFAYSAPSWGWGVHDHNGTISILEDDATRTVAIFENADLDNEYLNRGWFVIYK
ncbi:hypothetical protein [Muribaculum intestinale]|uniref:hypothetical protein n=1 Tax=Muribaculum intestinale TaxID=1796646 RepID=UPI0025A99E1D|nr:hypothetical protein [Muribaculum intestinale]